MRLEIKFHLINHTLS